MRRMAKVMETLTLSGFDGGGVLWLRYNPNAFQVDGVTQDARSMPGEPRGVVGPMSTMGIEYAYYDADAGSKKYLDHSW